MRTLTLLSAVACLFTLAAAPGSARAEEVFKIQIGKDYTNYSDQDLRRRVWELERAVWQMQQRVYQLEADKAQAPVDSWVCTVQAMGDTYTGTGPSKAVATANSIENCKRARGDGFFCKNPQCGN
jgi:hypothetical protein